MQYPRNHLGDSAPLNIKLLKANQDLWNYIIGNKFDIGFPLQKKLFPTIHLFWQSYQDKMMVKLKISHLEMLFLFSGIYMQPKVFCFHLSIYKQGE